LFIIIGMPGTLYGVSENGWMTTEVFEEWFTHFSREVKERPLLLVFDGHLSHVSVNVILKAMDEDITILKFPPHVTDLLQPLDVTCFGPLKRDWEKMLNEWCAAFGGTRPLRKQDFVEKLGQSWERALTPENVRAGFRKTGKSKLIYLCLYIHLRLDKLKTVRHLTFSTVP